MLRKLPDLERSVTRAFHGTASPSDFHATLCTMAALSERLGLRADLAADPPAGAPEVPRGAGAEAGPEAEGPEGPGAGPTCSGDAAAVGGGGGGVVCYPAVEAPGVESALLRQLLAAAGDLRVAGAAREILGMLDEEAAAANDLQQLLRRVCVSW